MKMRSAALVLFLVCAFGATPCKAYPDESEKELLRRVQKLEERLGEVSRDSTYPPYASRKGVARNDSMDEVLDKALRRIEALEKRVDRLDKDADRFAGKNSGADSDLADKLRRQESAARDLERRLGGYEARIKKLESEISGLKNRR